VASWQAVVWSVLMTMQAVRQCGKALIVVVRSAPCGGSREVGCVLFFIFF
jgi:hypothetical protein